MAKPKKVPPGVPATAPPYQPPQQLLAHCPHCDGTVLIGVVNGGTVAWQEPALTPVTGDPHDCDQALAQALLVHGLRWNTVRIVAQQAMRAMTPPQETAP